MAHVVTEACIRCKFTDCVEVCPVDCFHEGKNMLVIDPDECIDCTLCVSECPVDAILPEDELDSPSWLTLNREYAAKWPVITQKMPAPPDADEWTTVADKYPDHFAPEAP